MNALPNNDFQSVLYEERLANLIGRQGIKLGIQGPEDFGKDIWPSEDSVDEFLTWLRNARQEKA